MIDIEYLNGEIKITTKEISSFFPKYKLPLIINIKNTVSNEIVWTVNLSDNMWASYNNSEMNYVEVNDIKNTHLFDYKWDVMDHGSIFYKSLWLYCLNIISEGRTPKGLVIGSHDGEFGEWVPLALENKSNITLVEASEKQFSKLSKNYTQKHIHLINDLITPNGGEVEFYEGGRGYTNSVVERVIRNWEIEEIHTTKRNSISLNDLIRDILDGEIDWLHLDVEGLDAKLIMSMDGTYRKPPFIIFEDHNLLDVEKEEIYTWLKERQYTLHSESGICMATKTFI
jgi:hypothetical protein